MNCTQEYFWATVKQVTVNVFIQMVVCLCYTPDVSEEIVASIVKVTELFQVASDVTGRKKFAKCRL
jgi:hypothetical protein